ncbi:hypothetical protein G9A89_014732 [Geosiphon pyriformis]|nr:hypothetical protein G9A89_014732 [Geosiphon pyriformis]
MTTTRAKSKKTAPDICSEISNKISTREALSVVEATRQNVLEAFSLFSNHEKLPLVVTELTSSSLAGFLPVKIPSKRHTWVSSSVASTLTKSPKVFNNRLVNKLVFPSIDSTPGASDTTSSKKMVKKTKISGATSGNAWETIISHQRFAGWVASTLVPSTIFKIKLAHVKAVFQSVHGFLGAKSVSKDNVKLFCVEFASQQSLEAVFLVELTSSVHLTTLKIAKSLVVSEFGSSSAAVALRDVPLGVSAADVKLALSVFGSVTHVVMKSADIWQYMVVYFEKLDSAVSALKHWSVLIDKDNIRILLLVNQNETILSCDKFKTKLVNLPPGCTTFEISDLDSAVVKTGTLRKCRIWWKTPGCRHCFRCQEIGHLAVDCKISPPSTPKVSKVFKFHFVGSVSYAKTSVLSGLSEFLPLVALLAASAADPAVDSRLNSLEKQISDLAALIKSIVEPVGFLVALVSRLLDDNTVKTVQVEKDIISMKSAANNFSNLMVRVSKNIACLRSEVDFGNMDYDSMLAAKPSFLSEDTIECVIALWHMSGAETRGNIESTRLFLKAAPSSGMLNKKAPVGAFSGSTGGPFSQKKRVSLCHMIQFGDKHKAALAKPRSKGSQYSNMESDSGNSVASDILAGGGDGSLFGSAATTPKVKRVKNNLDCGSSLGSLDYNIDDNNGGPLPPPLGISLDRIWLDPKIIKTQVEVADSKDSAHKENFLKNHWFGGATTPSKFEGIIRSTFTSEESMKKAASLAGKNGIIVNTDFKRQGVCSNRTVVIKEIPMDMPKEMIITTQKAIVEFAESSQADLLASKWSFLIRKDSVRVAKAVGDHETWAFRDQFRMLLFTLPVEMTAHDLGTLLEEAGGKTCVINCSLETGNKTRCAVVCFESDEAMESAFHTESIFGSVKFSWARLDLVCCKQYGKFGHSVLKCNAGVASASQSSKLFKKPANLDTHLQLAKLYAKKKVPISRSVAFGGKSWAQVVLVASAFHSPHDGSGSGFLPFGASSSGGTPPPLSMVNSPLGTHLARLKHSVELLFDQILNILLRFDNLSLVPSAPSFSVILSVDISHPSVSNFLMVADFDLGSNMPIFLSSGNDNFQLGVSSSKVLTSKVGILESKLVVLDASIGSILVKLEQMCAGSGPLGINVSAKQTDVVHWHIKDKFDRMQIFSLELNKGFMGAGVAIVMNTSLACHVSKMEEIPGQVVSVWLLFKSKLSVTVLGLYAGVSFGARFGQASEVNFLIAKAVNSSNFVILGGDFNENRSGKSASFKFCLSLSLVNSFVGHYLADSHTWSNLKGVGKMLDYIFVGGNLSFAVAGHQVVSVSDFFNTNHRAVVILVSLSGLLDVQLNSLRKQANKDCWKFKIKNADCTGWAKFKDLSSAKLLSLSEMFFGAEMCGDVDAMWAVLVRAVVDSADVTFSRHWFFGLELLVAKIVKKFCSGDLLDTDCLVSKWLTLNDAKTHAFKDLVSSGVKSDVVVRHLSLVCRDYRRSKMFESRLAEKALVRKAIEKCMDNFCLDKSNMIRSVLEKPFRKWCWIT